MLLRSKDFCRLAEEPHEFFILVVGMLVAALKLSNSTDQIGVGFGGHKDEILFSWALDMERVPLKVITDHVDDLRQDRHGVF